MKLLAEGRASEIFDLEDGTVLRRFKRGGDPSREARLMEYARRHGYPVPSVIEIRADALVIEKIEGPTMAEALRDRPSEDLAEAARRLARLLELLHAIDVPTGDALVHLDLHHKNVIMSPTGPVVIDWANAGYGDPAVDVALTYVILMTSSGPRGRELGEHFASHLDVTAGLVEATRFRLRDANVTDAERAAVERLVG